MLDRLTDAVRDQLGENNDEDFRQTMQDVANHGADAGYGGFTYTSDCVAFHDANEADIWQMAADDAEEFGHKSVAEFVGTFGRADMASDPDQFKNLLAWYALETVACHVSDLFINRPLRQQR